MKSKEKIKIGSERETKKSYFWVSTERTIFASEASQIGSEGVPTTLLNKSIDVGTAEPCLPQAGNQFYERSD